MTRANQEHEQFDCGSSDESLGPSISRLANIPIRLSSYPVVRASSADFIGSFVELVAPQLSADARSTQAAWHLHPLVLQNALSLRP